MTAVAEAPPEVRRGGSPARPLRMLVGIIGVCVVAWLTANIFLSLAYHPGWYANNRILMALVGMIAGLGGAACCSTSSTSSSSRCRSDWPRG